VGRLERPDRRPFAKDDAIRCLEGLHAFFSFVAGHQTGPVLPVGFDEKGHATWADWSVPTLSARTGSGGWFSRMNPEQMADLFPLFLRGLASPRRETLRLATTYYAEANQQSNVQRSILLAHIALEAIAFGVLVSEQTLVSAEEFERQKIARSVRQLIGVLRLPIHVPTRLRALTELANREHWSDAAEVMSHLRNELVHLRPEAAHRRPAVWIDAWRLAVWYCEVAILAWLGYRGRYVNRVRGPAPLGGPLEDLPVGP
jgi:hypothetical protein